jgi:hypothetical protein
MPSHLTRRQHCKESGDGKDDKSRAVQWVDSGRRQCTRRRVKRRRRWSLRASPPRGGRLGAGRRLIAIRAVSAAQQNPCLLNHAPCPSNRSHGIASPSNKLISLPGHQDSKTSEQYVPHFLDRFWQDRNHEPSRDSYEESIDTINVLSVFSAESYSNRALSQDKGPTTV